MTAFIQAVEILSTFFSSASLPPWLRIPIHILSLLLILKLLVTMSIIFLEVVITTLLRSLNGRSSDYISLKKPSSMRSTTPEASSFQVPSSPNSQQANIKGQHTSFSVIIISCNTVINEKKHYYNILLPQVGAPVICQTPDNHTVIFPFFVPGLLSWNIFGFTWCHSARWLHLCMYGSNHLCELSEFSFGSHIYQWCVSTSLPVMFIAISIINMSNLQIPVIIYNYSPIFLPNIVRILYSIFKLFINFDFSYQPHYLNKSVVTLSCEIYLPVWYFRKSIGEVLLKHKSYPDRNFYEISR